MNTDAERNDLYNWLMVILIPACVFVFFFFYIDNPRAHSSSSDVCYIGEDKGLFVFQIKHLKRYHSRYRHKELFVRFIPVEHNEYSEIYSVSCTMLRNGKFCVDNEKVISSAKIGEHSYVSGKGQLQKVVWYSIEITGTHNGVLFNRPAKKITGSFLLE